MPKKSGNLLDFQQDPYLRIIRPLVQAYLAFYRTGSRHIERLGVTPAQFDVLAELGGTSGLTCAELSAATLITKGTLTGVLDRLERKGLLKRTEVVADRRATHVRLTARGEALYRKHFPVHGDFLRPYLQNSFTPKDIDVLYRRLCLLRDSFERPSKQWSKRKRTSIDGKTR